MQTGYPSFRTVMSERHSTPPVRIAGAHSALGAVIAQQTGFDAIWASGLEISAARCVPDASLLSMTEYLDAARGMQKALSTPVVADCDTGFGDTMNVAYMVREYESSGITAVCVEDKIFPKLNSFASGSHALLNPAEFVRKIAVAKEVQRDNEFYLIARTEAMICGLGVEAALERCRAYADAGADAVLPHSKHPTEMQVAEFLNSWDGRVPVIVVPTTYPNWHIDAASAAGVAAVVYANQGLRATITALRSAFDVILDTGSSRDLEGSIASMRDVFELQRLAEWQRIADTGEAAGNGRRLLSIPATDKASEATTSR